MGNISACDNQLGILLYYILGLVKLTDPSTIYNQLYNLKEIILSGVSPAI